MTDPFTLLAERPPAVPDAPPGERAAARAVLEAAIRAEPRPVALPASRRARVLVGAAAAAGLAVVAATAVQLWPSTTPQASAAWAPEPGRLSPAEVDVVDASCRSALETDVPADLDLVHVDRRGGTALAFYEGDAGAGRSPCLTAWDGTTWQAVGATEVAWVVGREEREGGWLGVDHLLDVAVGSEDTSGYTWVAGLVDAEVARVEVVRGGEPLEASLADGRFTVFWPTEQDPGDVEVLLYDGGGAVLLEYVYTEEDIARHAADDEFPALGVEVVEPEPAG